MKLDWAVSDHKDAVESRLLSYTQMTEQFEDTISKLEKDKVWFEKEKEEKKFLILP